MNGSKIFITNAGTDITACVTITAQTGEDEISNIIVPNGTPGYEISKPMKKLGWRASDTRELSFKDTAVPEANLLGPRGKGFQQFLEILDGGRISVAAMGVGLARAYDLACVRAGPKRQQFGKSIARFQAVQFKLADMATELEAGRNPSTRPRGSRIRVGTSRSPQQAKLYTGELPNRAVNWASRSTAATATWTSTRSRGSTGTRRSGDRRGTIEVQRMVIARHLGL